MPKNIIEFLKALKIISDEADIANLLDTDLVSFFSRTHIVDKKAVNELYMFKDVINKKTTG